MQIRTWRGRQDRFRSLVPDAAGVEVKAMFVNLAGFVNGDMVAGLPGPAIGVKLLDEASRDALAAIAGYRLVRATRAADARLSEAPRRLGR